jgi:uncharacterized membrane protein
LSYGIFAVVITVMVLELRPPEGHDLSALLGLWPNVVSYAFSYLFIAVIWLNHHHIFRFGRKLTGALAWSNFANLFSISLIPFSTAWLASSRIAAFPLAVYAIVFLLIELTYIALMYETLRQAIESPADRRAHRVHFKRAWIMVAMFTLAAIAYPVPGIIRLLLMASFLILHVRPDLMSRKAE